MGEAERYIDGIFNYCDRWCERCAFTGRCRAFAMEGEVRRRVARREREAEAFWEAMERAVGEGLEEVAAKASELGREDEAALAAFEEGLRDADEGEEEFEAAMGHPLAKVSLAYGMAAQAFLREHDGGQQRGELAEDVRDAVEVIGWYSLFIHVKLTRALRSLAEEREEEVEFGDGEGRDWPRDSEGSAKVAIVAVERSMGAWSRLRELEPGVAVERMGELARIRGMVDRVFPGARAFRRPGFDG